MKFWSTAFPPEIAWVPLVALIALVYFGILALNGRADRKRKAAQHRRRLEAVNRYFEQRRWDREGSSDRNPEG